MSQNRLDQQDERFCEIEAKVAFQEKSVQEMSDVLLEQQKQISQLETVCQYLGDQVKLLMSEFEQTSGHEKPPHY